MARPKCYETAAQKQKAYRERKKTVTIDVPQSREASGIAMQITTKPVSQHTVQSLRELIKQEEEKPATEDLRKPGDVIGGIYRNDQGGVISKFAWEKLQRMKEAAKEGGYILDDYSQ
jgi:hypothetical protein